MKKKYNFYIIICPKDMNARGGGRWEAKMRGDGEGGMDNGIKLTRRGFIKMSAAFGAAVAGIPPYNLTDITDVFLKGDGELVMYPIIADYKFELVRKLPFERFISIEL